jgi:cell division septation protein DedD
MRISEILVEAKIINVAEGFFDWFKSKPPEDIEPPEFIQTFIRATDGFSYISFTAQGANMQLSANTETVQDAKFALEELKVLKQAMQFQKKEFQLQAQEIQQEFSQQRANQGAMIPGGGKFGTALRYSVRASRAAARGRVSDHLQNYNSIIRAIESLLQVVAKTELTLKREIITGNIEPIVKPAKVIDTSTEKPIAKKKSEPTPTEKPIAKKKSEPTPTRKSTPKDTSSSTEPKKSVKMADLPVSARNKAKADNPNLRYKDI